MLLVNSVVREQNEFATFGEGLLPGIRALLMTRDKHEQRKEGRDIVTSMDRAIQNYIATRIRTQYPQHAITAEENLEVRGERYTWVIDPIDGTINYASGLPMFATSVALLENGRAIYGMIFAPELEKTYSAIRGVGAFLNGKRIACDTICGAQNALISVMLTSHYAETVNAITAELLKVANLQFRGVRVIVCQALELGLIAEGRLQGSISIKADPFGTMAGQLIVEEAGGKVTDCFGGEFGARATNIVASNGPLHAALLELVQSALQNT